MIHDREDSINIFTKSPAQALSEYGLAIALVGVVALSGILVMKGDILEVVTLMFSPPSGPSAPLSPVIAATAPTSSGNSPGDINSGQAPTSDETSLGLQGDGTESLNLTLSNGQTVALDVKPVNVNEMIETTGANGTTLVLAQQIEKVSSQLLSQGLISQSDANQLKALANQGYRFADIQATVLKQAKQYGNDGEGFNFGQITFEGRSYSNPDALISTIGVGTDYYGWNTSSDKDNSPGPELVKMQNLLSSAQKLSIMKEPAVNTLVTGLTTQIMDIGKGMEDVVNPNNYPGSYQQGVTAIANAYKQTASNSGTICSTGGGSNNGITCK